MHVHSVTVSQSLHCHPAALQKQALLAATAKPSDVAGAQGLTVPLNQQHCGERSLGCAGLALLGVCHSQCLASWLMLRPHDMQVGCLLAQWLLRTLLLLSQQSPPWRATKSLRCCHLRLDTSLAQQGSVLSPSGCQAFLQVQQSV